MHSKVSRQELNRRFKSVYSDLESRGEIVKSNRQKSKSAFAASLGTKSHIVNLYLNDKRLITYAQAKLLCSKYGISEAYMFQGIGEPFDEIVLPNPGKKIMCGFRY